MSQRPPIVDSRQGSSSGRKHVEVVAVSSGSRPGSKRKVLLLGKLPPPYMGPAITTQILLGSELKNRYRLLHIDTTGHTSLDMIGKWSPKKVANYFALCRKLFHFLRVEKPDLVIVPISQSTIGFVKDSIPLLLCGAAQCRTVVYLMGSNILNWLARSSIFTRKYFEVAMRGADAAIVLGMNLRYLFSDYMADSRIFVVPNGADYQFPEPTPRKDDRLQILYLANLVSSKGIEDVLEAVRMLDKGLRDMLYLNVVGAWLDRRLENVCKLSVTDDNLPVTFHSPALNRAKLQYYADADVFVFPPREPEGHPWVIVEALAAGLPIISTDQGAIVESVVDGHNGFIVEPNRPDQIAERLRFLTTDPELRRRMGLASRLHYEQHYTEAIMTQRFIHAFESVINRSIG